MLHIAPESGIRILLEKRQNLDYFSGDIKSNQTSLKIDITDLQFDDNSFDVIYACHVLNALEDDMLAMSEAYRVLKPGGWALLQVPVSDEKEATVEETSSGEDRLRSFRDERIYRIYGADYGVRLQRAGFRVRRDPFIERFDEKQRTTYGLQREYLYICTK